MLGEHEVVTQLRKVRWTSRDVLCVEVRVTFPGVGGMEPDSTRRTGDERAEAALEMTLQVQREVEALGAHFTDEARERAGRPLPGKRDETIDGGMIGEEFPPAPVHQPRDPGARPMLREQRRQRKGPRDVPQGAHQDDEDRRGGVQRLRRGVIRHNRVPLPGRE